MNEKNAKEQTSKKMKQNEQEEEDNIMAENKRQLVLDALDNKPVERVPVGFWYHYAFDALYEDSPKILSRNLAGHQKFFDAFHPDFVKIMSDGYFRYPNPTVDAVKTAADLRNVKAADPQDWIDKQVHLVKEVNRKLDHKLATFYNVFAPATYLKWLLDFNHAAPGSGNDFRGTLFNEFLKEDPEAVRIALSEIAKDVKKLAAAVIREGGADGIYFSFQNIQGAGLSREEYQELIAPSELEVLEAANEAGDYNILHICGYEGAVNDLTYYIDYPAKAINYAATVEGISLGEAKKLFGGRAVIGGFNNTRDGILYKGSKEEIQDETRRILEESGTTGIILGADCTVPADTPVEHYRWVREAAALFAKAKAA